MLYAIIRWQAELIETEKRKKKEESCYMYKVLHEWFSVKRSDLFLIQFCDALLSIEKLFQNQYLFNTRNVMHTSHPTQICALCPLFFFLFPKHCIFTQKFLLMVGKTKWLACAIFFSISTNLTTFEKSLFPFEMSRCSQII